MKRSASQGGRFTVAMLSESLICQCIEVAGRSIFLLFPIPDLGIEGCKPTAKSGKFSWGKRLNLPLNYFYLAPAISLPNAAIYSAND
jgi:hypothetical protein